MFSLKNFFYSGLYVFETQISLACLVQQLSKLQLFHLSSGAASKTSVLNQTAFIDPHSIGYKTLPQALADITALANIRSMTEEAYTETPIHDSYLASWLSETLKTSLLVELWRLLHFINSARAMTTHYASQGKQALTTSINNQPNRQRHDYTNGKSEQYWHITLGLKPLPQVSTSASMSSSIAA